jgi:hypothetical protein
MSSELEGALGSFPQRRVAVDYVRDVDGVLSVIDKLKVSLRKDVEVGHEFGSELSGVVGVANEMKVKTPRPADERWR